MTSSTSSPCAACKFLRRKCVPECIFAPYFPPDQPLKFANAHKIFGASNISKILNDLPPHQRQDAVNSLAYEAEARIRDPVYGCVGAISYLKRHIAVLEHELTIARSELARYMGIQVIGGPSIDPHTGTLSATHNTIGTSAVPASPSEHLFSSRQQAFNRDQVSIQGTEFELQHEHSQIDNQFAREQILHQVLPSSESELIAMGETVEGRSSSSGAEMSMISGLASP